jgi:hypothetical protein
MELQGCFEKKCGYLNLPENRQSILDFGRFFGREDSTSVQQATENLPKLKRRGVGFCGNWNGYKMS